MTQIRNSSIFAASFLLATGAFADPGPIDDKIAHLQHEWARIKYTVHDEKTQAEQMVALASEAKAITAANPARPEALIWNGIIVSSAAGMKGGLGALGMVTEARDLLEKAEKIDAKALDGSAITSLGSLYYQVPGFPVGFGSDKKARQYLERAVALNPDGIDANFFYGDFLMHEGEYAKAASVLRHALDAPDRPGREDADSGRREEIRGLLAQADAKLAKKKKS